MNTSIEKLFKQQQLALDQMPVLRDVFEKVAGACVEDIREWLTTPVSMLVNGVEMSTAWDALEAYEDCVAFIFYAPSWDSRIVIGIDKRMVYYLLEGVFGGDGSTAPFDEGRAISVLEVRFAREIADVASRALANAFADIAPTDLALERVEQVIEFTMLGQADFPTAVCQVLLQVLDQGGRMFIMMPQAALHQMRSKLARSVRMGNAQQDPVWTQRLRDSLAGTAVDLDAVMVGTDLTFEDIAQLRLGQIIEVHSGRGGGVILQCGDTALFDCQLGKSNGFMAVRVDDAVAGSDRFIGGLTAKGERRPG